MISKNRNKKIIRKLALNDLKKNRVRNSFVIFAVMLTTLLFVSITSTAKTITASQDAFTLKSYGTSEDVMIFNTFYDDVENFESHEDVEKVVAISTVGLAVNDGKYFREVVIEYKSTIEDEVTHRYKHSGTTPSNINDVVVSSEIIKAVDSNLNIGDNITLKYSINEETYEEEFNISGIYEVGVYEREDKVFISEKKFEEINSISPLGVELALYLNSDIDSDDIEYTAHEIISELGYEYYMQDVNEAGIDFMVSPVHRDINDDATLVAFVAVMVVLVFISGFLMISNIFESSMIKDMELYAQLKTIGATTKQIRNIFIYQGLLLSVIAITAGIGISMVVTKKLVSPLSSLADFPVESISVFSASTAVAIVYSLLTVYFSIIRAYRIIKKKTPIEMYNYTGKIKMKKRRSKSLNLFKMGFYSAKSSRFKFYSMVVSLSIIPILLSSIYGVGFSFDKEKFLVAFAPTDLIVRYQTHEITQLSDFDIDAYKDLDKQGGMIYLDSEELTTSAFGETFDVFRYVVDEYLLEKYYVMEGEVDYNKLSDGYVIVMDRSFGEENLKVGESIEISNTRTGEKEAYEVMAIVDKTYSFHKQYYTEYDLDIIMGESTLEDVSGNLEGFVYAIDVEGSDSEELELIADNERLDKRHLDITSRGLAEGEFEILTKGTIIPATFMGGILLLIAISNYINITITNIITKQKEYAIMKSIGMTSKQYRKLIIYEGLSCVMISMLLSLVFGTVFNLVVVRDFAELSWVATYNYSTLLVLPLVNLLYVVILLPVPIIVDKLTSKKSIVEIIRE